MKTNNTSAAEDYMIRALYAAKAEFKDASSELVTAERNLEATKSDPLACAGDRVDACTVRQNALARYMLAEKAYNIVSNACQRLALI